jgi:hypothetical protein
LSKENKTGKLLIVDGQQRLMSLFSFYDGLFKGKEFALVGLQSDLNGKTYKTLNSSDKIRLDDSILHATIVRQDEPNDEESSIYLIFERLNTGGKPLSPQEIRACIYYGQFNQFLNKLKDVPGWRKIFGPENERLKEQELILRFFALFYERDSYQKPLKGFLNKFMAKNRDFEKYKEDALAKLFTSTIEPFAKFLGNKAFRVGRVFNAAAFDAIMVGCAERVLNGPQIDEAQFLSVYSALIEDPVFIDNIRGGTSDENAVEARIKLAISQFAKI